MNLSLTDLLPEYSVPAEDFTFDLPHASGEPVKVTFRRVRNAAELAEIKRAAVEWVANARALAPTPEDRAAIGELAGDIGKEYMMAACIMAATLRDDSGKSLNDLRYIFCRMAAEAGPTFETLKTGLAVSMMSSQFLHFEDAESGKEGCGLTPPCETSCESPGTCGANTPTN